MAKFEDGMYAHISGTVEDVVFAKSGMMLKLATQRKWAQYPDRLTVWDVTGGFCKGDSVKVKGWLSWQRKEADNGKTYFNVSINKPEIIDIEKALSVEQVAQDILGATPIDEAPF